ncbi:ABC transporter permease [Mesobaculum littorinae]|uniref:ABC transporter permease n=1 Tax=Mesobaculum littorinae TaxID=2486419 RepID=A0A438AJV9_9RHOB|nr:ABC transporter permease [Mesobaculum littorinae]RVV98926.1 ABC transporter permease [Mesobaculum littorinae]
MRFELIRRDRASLEMALMAPVLALLAAGLVSWALFAAMGVPAGRALWTIAATPFSTWYDFSEVLVKTAPLLLIAQGLAIGFRARVFNIGAEGQLLIGAICASAIPVLLPSAGSPLLWVAMMALGMVGGAAWAAIAAFWRTRLNANEILVTLMLSLIAAQILTYLLLGPWKDPMGMNFPQTRMFQPGALLPGLLPGTRVNLSLLFGVAATIAAYVFMQRSVTGFRLIVTGTAPRAAGYAGVSAARGVWLSLLISGAAAGLAGAAEVAGPLGQLQRSISQGYGFAAIIVAYLGGLHPVGIAVSSLVMSAIYIGGDNAMVFADLPQSAVLVVQGLLLTFYLIAATFVRYRIAWTGTARA